MGDDTSAAVPVTVGLKQGCPLSPILFNLYLNPLLLAIEHKEFSCPSALAYADDIVFTASSAHHLQSSLRVLEGWCADFGLTINVGKCGWLQLGKVSEPLESLQVEGSAIPRVSSYTYLGVEVTEGFVLTTAAEARIAKTVAVLNRCKSFLSSPLVSMGDKALVVSAIVAATATYCCSLFVASKQLLDAIQRPLSDAALLAVGSSAGRRLTSVQAALRLLGVPPVHAVALRQAIKVLVTPTFEVLSGLRGDVGWKREALTRLGSLRSPSGALLDARTTQSRGWSLWEVGRWGELTRSLPDSTSSPPKSLLVWRGAAVSENFRKRLLQLSRLNSSLAAGFLTLGQLLVNGRLTFARLSAAKKVKLGCLFCGDRTDDSPLHELFRCVGLQMIRDKTVKGLVKKITGLESSLQLRVLLSSPPQDIIRVAAFFFQVHQQQLKTSPALG